LGVAWFAHGIISLLIGTADVALVAVITVADAIGIRYLGKRRAVRARGRALDVG
jgi:hypothetical protein